MLRHFEFFDRPPPLPSAQVPERPTLRQASEAVAGRSILARDIDFLRYFGHDFHSLYLATQRAHRLGVTAHSVLIADNVISQRQYLMCLGQYLSVPVITGFRPDDRISLQEVMRQGWCRGVLADGRDVMVVCAEGRMVEATMLIQPARRQNCIVLVTSDDFRASLYRHHTGWLSKLASYGLPEIHSARAGANRLQLTVIELALVGFIAACVFFPDMTRLLAPLIFGLFFMAHSAITLAAAAFRPPLGDVPVCRDDASLPQYSVLVPMYREAAVARQLVSALDQFDYPTEKLQILLVLEEEDTQTRAALEAVTLPAHIRVFIAPAGQPRTKPRALNAALPFVTGDHVVIYDAEDRPDPLQLRAAVAAFAKAPANIGCLQARLSIDNTDDSWLTRLFTLEYIALFDVVKAGTARLGFPVPLGGTSNHFRTATLRRLGGWDAWNVTEDADLGLRLARYGYIVQDLNSITDEEAPNRLGAWMKQRTRWLKGWMQTIITHSKSPLQSLSALGPMQFTAAVAVSSGVVVGALGAPLFLVLLLLRLLSDEPFISGPALYQFADVLMLVLIVVGAVATFLPVLMGAYRRRMWHLLPWVIVIPAYQMLVSVAAWLALVELVRAPFHWNKTTHGQARTSRAGHDAEKP